MPIDYGDEEITKEEIETARKASAKHEPIQTSMMTHGETESLWQKEEDERSMAAEIKAAKREHGILKRAGRLFGKGKEEAEATYRGVLAGQHPEIATPDYYPQRQRRAYASAKGMTKRLIGAHKTIERGESWFKKAAASLVEPLPPKPEPKKPKAFEPKSLFFKDYVMEQRHARRHRKKALKKTESLKFGYMKDGRFVEVRR
jgi:hypothetical protein